MLAGTFKIDKDFIKFQIPSNLRDTWTFERVVDIFYAAISEIPSGAKITQYYSDLEYYTTDFTKLSTEMKLQKLSDNGYSYLLGIFDDETLNNLSVFLVLLKILKGRYEGFKLILDALDFDYKLETWDNPPEVWKESKFQISASANISDEGVFKPSRNVFVSKQFYPLLSANQDIKYTCWYHRSTSGIYNESQDVCTLVFSSAGTLESSDSIDISLENNSTLVLSFAGATNSVFIGNVEGDSDWLDLEVTLNRDTVTLNATVNKVKTYTTSVENPYGKVLKLNMLNIMSRESLPTSDVDYHWSGTIDLTSVKIYADGVNRFSGSTQFKGEVFTATITLTLTAEQAQIATSIIDKLQKIAWDYLAPSVNIEYTVVEELLSEDAIFNSYFSSGYVKYQNYPQFEISRSL